MDTVSDKDNRLRTLRRQLARRDRELRDITQRSGYRTINKETVVARSRIRYIHFKIKELT